MTTRAASYHARRIRELSAAADWAGLVRHWMAYRHEPAIAEAIAVAQRREAAGPPGQLAQYLRDFHASPDRPRAPFAGSPLPGGTPQEELTLLLLGFYPCILLCEQLSLFAEEECGELFRLGAEAANKGWNIARTLEDRALSALFVMVMCNGWLFAEAFDRAHFCCEQALQDYRAVEGAHPGVVLRELGMAHFNNGLSLRGLRRAEEAAAQLDEAAACFRRLGGEEKGACEGRLASALALAGGIRRELGQLEEARARLEEAREIAARRPTLRPGESLPDLFEVGESLGTVQRKLGQLEEARRSFEGALEHLGHGPPGFALAREAATHINLGLVLDDLEQFGQAIEHTHTALRLFHQIDQLRPGYLGGQFANTLEHLGDVLSKLGRYAEAREHYLRALEIYDQSPDEFLPQRAALLRSLGVTEDYLRLLASARENDERSVALFRRLEAAARRPGAFLYDLLIGLTNLGHVLRKLRKEQEALCCYEEAWGIRERLAAGSPDALLPELASIQGGRGLGMSNLYRLDQARDHFEQALRIRRGLGSTPDMRLHVAMTLQNLGNTLDDLRNPNLARSHHEEALRMRRQLAREYPGRFQFEVAMSLDSLGGVCTALGDLKEALQYYEEAVAIFRDLEAREPGVHTPGYAMTLSNLAVLWRKRCDLDLARKHFEESLGYCRQLARDQARGAYAPELGAVLFNLGALLNDLRDPVAARSFLEEALASFRALEEEQPGGFRHATAMTLYGLGVLYTTLTVTHVERDGDTTRLVPAAESPKLQARQYLDEALLHYRVLEGRFPGVFLPHVAVTLVALGLLHASRNLEEARGCYEEGVGLLRNIEDEQPGAYRRDLLLALTNLGACLRDLKLWDAARACFEEAIALAELEEGNHNQSLEDGVRCHLGMALLLLSDAPDRRLPDAVAARNALRQAVACAEQYRHQFLAPHMRRQALKKCLPAYESLLQTCIDIERHTRDGTALAEALETAEAIRARRLGELLADETLRPINAPDDTVTEFQRLRAQLRAAELDLLAVEDRPTATVDGKLPGLVQRHDGGPWGWAEYGRSPEQASTARQEVDRLRQQQGDLVRRIREWNSAFDPDTPLPPLDADAARRLVPVDVSSAIVHYTVVDQQAVALIVTRDAIEAVPLPKLAGGLGPHVVRWQEAYFSRREKFDEGLASALEPIAEHAVRPVVEHLAGRGYQRLILLPSRGLHLFPLHACRLADGRYLADHHEVVYAPSLALLDRCARRERHPRTDLLLIENPTLDPRLAFTEAEGQRLCGYYPASNPLYGSGATRAAFLEHAAGCHVLHYTGHARFMPLAPLRSGLVLDADERNWLTLRDLFCSLRLPNNRLTVLNGCETGMMTPDGLDEFVTLSTGFLYAGATCVLSSLWRVYDLPSALLVDRFHQEWLGTRPGSPPGGRSAGDALGRAQRWLREIRSGPELQHEVLPEFLQGLEDVAVRGWCEGAAADYARAHPDSNPFAGPAHWAAFTAVGLSYPLPQVKG